MSSKKNITLLVLAAGMGSRYGGIKQIDGFGPNGETIMDYSLYDCIHAGFTKVVFIVREEIKETVKEIFLPRLNGKVEVDFVVQSIETMMPAEYQNIERSKPWGTAHAVLCAKDIIHEPFAVINADDFYGRAAFESVVSFFNSPNTNSTDVHAMVGYTLRNVLSENGSVSRGCGEQDENGFLKTVVERTTIVKENGKIISREGDGDRELSPNTPTSMNFWAFHPTIFTVIEKLFLEFLKENGTNPKAEFFIPLVGNKIIERGLGKVKVIGGGDIWFGVTYKEDKEEVSGKIKALVESGVYPEKLW